MRKKPLLFLVGVIPVAALMTAASFVDCSLKVSVPTTKETIGILVLVIPLAVVVTLVLLKGVKHTCYLLIPYLVCFALLEVGARWWIAHNSDRSVRARFYTPFTAPGDLGSNSVYVPNHYTLYNLRPNLALPDGTMHNRLGMRDDRDLATKDHAIRIVFIGGSTTYTIGIRDNRKIFSSVLEERLNEHYRDRLQGYRVEVVNAGMGGATSAENLLRLIFFVSELEPDLVVIQHGLNDVRARMYGDLATDFSNYRKPWSTPLLCCPRMPVMVALVHRIIDHSVVLTMLSGFLGRSGYSVADFVVRADVEKDADLLSRNGTRYFERNTRFMIAVCRSLGAQVLLASEPFTERAGAARMGAMPEHNALLRSIAANEGVLFYDFAADMIKDDQHMPDGRHMSQLGSDVKCEKYFTFFVSHEIVPKLKEKLESARSAAP